MHQISAAWIDNPYATQLELLCVEFDETLGDRLVDDELLVVPA